MAGARSRYCSRVPALYAAGPWRTDRTDRTTHYTYTIGTSTPAAIRYKGCSPCSTMMSTRPIRLAVLSFLLPGSSSCVCSFSVPPASQTWHPQDLTADKEGFPPIPDDDYIHQALSAQPDEAVARRVLRHRSQAELREPPDRVVGPQIGQRHVKVRAGDGRAGHALGFVHRRATRGI